ncbi:MAG: hypothetical protein WBM53_03210 [Maribacter sp.]
MKRTIMVMILFTLPFASCKQESKENQKKSETQSETTAVEKKHELNNDWVNEIFLNNDIKWQANLETTNGVGAMLSLIGGSKLSSRDDYKKLGNGLNEIRNTVVKECTMKGASHDNLHVWLHPLVEKIALLQNIENPKDGAQITSNIKEHLEAYYDYFE